MREVNWKGSIARYGHGMFISASFVVACGRLEMRLGSVELLVGTFRLCGTSPFAVESEHP